MANGFAVYPFAFGCLKIGYQADAVVYLQKTDSFSDSGVATALSDEAYRQLQEYCEGRRKFFDFPYRLYGTAFQQKVWQALCRIPYGETRSYGQIAAETGNPKAARAVGMANNRNPMMIVVPCHRVVGANGSLVGYEGGLDMKQALLDLEKRYV